MAHVGRWRAIVAVAFLAACAASAIAADVGPSPSTAPTPTPYVDPSQLDVPWPRHSHLKQPHRAYMDTVPALSYLQGVGVNLNVDANPDVAARMLSEFGFRTVRIEIGWSSVNWDETGLIGADALIAKLEACKRYALRPLILLNANHGAPCPYRDLPKTLAEDAPAGAREVKLTDPSGVVPGYTGFSNLTGYKMAEVLITAIDPKTGVAKLSKPLPKPIKAGVQVPVHILKYRPFYPTGTPEFEETAAGFVRYARLVCSFVRQQHIPFDVEIWNELSFGSDFIRDQAINNYYDPPIATYTRDFLHRGGHAWEAARRVVAMIKSEFTSVRVIWGFSNTTFFHTPVMELPAGVDGQSYHPYGTGYRTFPKDEQHPDTPADNIDGFVPSYRICIPEGWAATFIQTESLMRLLNPRARLAAPPGTQMFRHYMTEHGVSPEELGVSDAAQALDLKARLLLRSTLFWLNKGISAIYLYCALQDQDTGMGMLLSSVGKLRAYPTQEELPKYLSPALLALRNMVKTFVGAASIAKPRALSVSYLQLGEPHLIFASPVPGGRSLGTRDALVVLPYQVTAHKFVLAVYVMTRDFTKRLEQETYRITIGGVNGRGMQLRLYDPLTDKTLPVKTASSTPDAITVEIPVADTPYLLTLDEAAQ